MAISKKDQGYIEIISTMGQKDDADFYIALAEDIQYKTRDDFDSDDDYEDYISNYRKNSVQEALLKLNTTMSSFTVNTETISADTWTTTNIYTYALKNTDSENVLLLVMPTPGSITSVYNAIAKANFEVGLYNDEATLVSRSVLPTVDINIDFIEIPLEGS